MKPIILMRDIGPKTVVSASVFLTGNYQYILKFSQSLKKTTKLRQVKLTGAIGFEPRISRLIVIYGVQCVIFFIVY